MVEHVRCGAQPRAAFGAAELPVGRRDGSYVPLTCFEQRPRVGQRVFCGVCSLG